MFQSQSHSTYRTHVSSIVAFTALLLLPSCVADFTEVPAVSEDGTEILDQVPDMDERQGVVDPEQQPSDPDFTTQGSASDWFCYGESTHTIVGNLVIWRFYTRNDSTRAPRDPSVHGTVFHPNGTTQTCYSNENNVENTCYIETTLESGYNSSAGQHRCCERRTWSYPCTNTFYTSDAL